MTIIHDMTAAELLAAYKTKSLSPVEAIDAVIGRIEKWEPKLKALYAPDFGNARKAAQESEKRWRTGAPQGSLDGVPITIKENIATKGVPVPLGTAATDLVAAASDAPAAARVRQAGAIILAKTTMPDFGMLSSGRSSFHPLTRNPWNLAWNPGGSSAGAGAAAAAGYGPLHLGTDIGGSVRLPASWNGIFTLKPSLGRIPVDPPFLGRAIGPMTRTVGDAALVMAAVCGPDARDHTSLPATDIDWSAGPLDPKGLKIGLMLDAGSGLPVDAEVKDAVEKAARLFADAGAVIEPLEGFLSPEMLHLQDLFWRVRSWADFSGLSHAKQASVLPFIADWCRGGADVSGVAVMRSINNYMAIRAATVRATMPFDFVLSPTSPVPTYPAEWETPTNDVNRPLEHISFTMPFNMSEQPAASINCGYTGEGKPIGLQIAGRRFDDLGVLRLSRWFESARGPQKPWPEPPVA
ncbi:aspartyl-tRNA(Asn)/glutamyl-tRNA(Gln) amidotransferase subunit A [Enhydrobacter aerosaccus]|uniref:Aspartyl-tRNA(Asn)/glutamyl-tRNA(Gln) amidotransferase subunit A n=1 Tax=Enhydrobacter aerosaccus TaxID=225324 RepID=A0A1T4TFV9_9HYPH|nr:amidase [Enhydrobacter aerosaccus]SKA39327.1 aspartyl-tRNA(Asn)/glutamyl-tRNA(Gln) amidotransferase subunit A [Enhydrobacter aerosaccus]